ncbi:MAG: trimethylamine methyltransferase family protein [Deltaproteobacteria bacterium]|nr:trimethylamine methyltransferase family protein [Deltaproteobacteria bacterium]
MAPDRHLTLLSEEEVEQIHAATLQVLEEVGLWLPNREVLEILEGAGAEVDFEKHVARYPADMVTAAIGRFPDGFTWYARNPDHTIRIDGSRTHFSMPDSALNVIGPDGKHRPGVPRDGEDICRLCDALPNMAVASTGINPPDMPGGLLEAWHTRTMFCSSSKAVFGVSREVDMVLEMARIVADTCDHLPEGVLPLVAIMNPFSPLYNEADQLAGMLKYARKGVPISISPEVQAGATGPATVAGALVQQTAEFLGHAVLVQCVQPGLGVIYGTVSSVFDMKKMILPYGAPEADILAVGTVQMARRYGIPARNTGGSSDANVLDMQAGAEAMMSTLIAILAGASFVLHGAGELENTMAVSYEKILLDDEIIDMSRRFARGLGVVDAETLAVDVIKQVGCGPPGQFLQQPHTFSHFRSEQFMPRLFVRDMYSNWEKAGRQTAEQRAAAEVERILATHRPEPLPDAAQKEIDAIYHAAEKAALNK